MTLREAIKKAQRNGRDGNGYVFRAKWSGYVPVWKIGFSLENQAVWWAHALPCPVWVPNLEDLVATDWEVVEDWGTVAKAKIAAAMAPPPTSSKRLPRRKPRLTRKP